MNRMLIFRVPRVKTPGLVTTCTFDYFVIKKALCVPLSMKYLKTSLSKTENDDNRRHQFNNTSCTHRQIKFFFHMNWAV